MDISLAEALLIIGTFGIGTGVWVTLRVIVNQGKDCDCARSEAFAITKGDKDAS